MKIHEEHEETALIKKTVRFDGKRDVT